MKDILLIFTGGTICSMVDKTTGHKNANGEKAQSILVENFRKSGSSFAKAPFVHRVVMDILSENMTLHAWDILIASLKDINWSSYQGVIVAHGTDTMAYTASLLSLLLANVPVPVVLVGADQPLENAHSNGNINFQRAVELICQDLAPDVYLVYRNGDQKTYLHRAAHLLQCEAYSDDFFSLDMQEFSSFANLKPSGDIAAEMLLYKMPALTNPVLKIEPYVGIDYQSFQLGAAKAVLHGLYHAGTACVERKEQAESYTSRSVLHLVEKCKKSDVLFFMGPSFDPQGSAVYSSAGDMMENGAIPVYGMTGPMTYVKILLAVNLFSQPEQILQFIRTPISHEFVYQKKTLS